MGAGCSWCRHRWLSVRVDTHADAEPVEPVLHCLRDLGEVVRVRPGQPDERIARIAGERLPGRVPVMNISPDGEYLSLLLIDAATTNIWKLPTAGGAMSKVTDFGDRCTLIVRSVSWSRDSHHIYAAVAERQTVVALLAGLL